MINDEGALTETVKMMLSTYREILQMLTQFHAEYAIEASYYLDEDERCGAVWKLSGQSLAHAMTLIELLDQGYTLQTWPVLKAIHEANTLLAAVVDEKEDHLLQLWLESKEIPQKEARIAMERMQSQGSKELKTAGLKVDGIDVARLKIYKALCERAHHRRSIVDQAVDYENRTMIYGPDPRVDFRFRYAKIAGVQVAEVLLLVGLGLAFLYGRDFYKRLVEPAHEMYSVFLGVVDNTDL